MIIGQLFAFAARYSEGGEGGNLLQVNPGLAFWTVLIFLLLLLILKKVAWKPILTALDERENKIRESLELAEKTKADAEKLVQENKQNLQKAEEEARKVIAEAAQYAAQLKEKLIEESKAQAKKIVDDASAEIDRKQQEALNNLKNQVADLSIEIAEKILKRNLSAEVHKSVIEEYIKEIQKN